MATGAIVSQQIVETLAVPAAGATVSQQVVETLVRPAAGATVSQMVIETLATNNVIALVSQMIVETLMSNVSGLVLVNNDRSSNILKRSVIIRDELNDAPNTMVMKSRSATGWIPAYGQGVYVSFETGSRRIFNGHVLSVDYLDLRHSQRLPSYRLNCIDSTWEFDFKRVEARLWTSISATLIVQQIVFDYCPAFSGAHVAAGMATITVQSNSEESPSQLISRIMKSIGGFWYIDYNLGVHAFVTAETDAEPFVLDSSNADFWDLNYSTDLSQVRTRTRVIGGSSTTTAIVAVSATTIPVDDTRLFGASGGDALLGACKATYTGKSVTTGPGNLTGVTGITTEVAQGESVRVLATGVNTSAVTSMLALLGRGDGYIEHSFEDGNMGDAAARLAAQADVDLFGTPDAVISFKTRSLTIFSGKLITANLLNPATGGTIIGTFQVQSITTHSFGQAADDSLYPIREVTAGSNKQNIFNLLGKLA